MKRPPAFSDQQLKVYGVLQRGRMAWIAFTLVMAMFVVVFGLFVYVTLWRPDVSGWTKTGMFLLDGVLGWSIKHIIAFLFPSSAAASD